MKATLMNFEPELDILVLDTDNLIESRYYEVIEMLEDQEFADKITDGIYIFYVDDVKYTPSDFLDWMNRDMPKMANDNFMNILLFDDRANSRLIGLRTDFTKFVINYTNA